MRPSAKTATQTLQAVLRKKKDKKILQCNTTSSFSLAPSWPACCSFGVTSGAGRSSQKVENRSQETGLVLFADIALGELKASLGRVIHKILERCN